MHSLIANGASVIHNNLKLTLPSLLSSRCGVFSVFLQRVSLKYRNNFQFLSFSFLLLHISHIIITKPEYLTRLPYHSLPLGMSLNQLIPHHSLIIHFLATIPIFSSTFLFGVSICHFPTTWTLKSERLLNFLYRAAFPSHCIFLV